MPSLITTVLFIDNKPYFKAPYQNMERSGHVIKRPKTSKADVPSIPSLHGDAICEVKRTFLSFEGPHVARNEILAPPITE